MNNNNIMNQNLKYFCLKMLMNLKFKQMLKKKKSNIKNSNQISIELILMNKNIRMAS